MATRIGGCVAAVALLAIGCGDPQEVTPAAQVTISRPKPATPTEPLAIILISIDTLRADHLSAYGYHRQTSPAIDRLAAESVLFEEAYSQSPKTAESHMTLMTGLYPEVHGVHNWHAGGARDRLSEGIPTLATMLRRAGYRTVAYTGGGNVRGELGFDQGFDVYGPRSSTEQVFQQAAAEVERWAAAPGDEARPLFLFLHTYEVHDPYAPAPAYAQLFTDPAYDGGIISSATALAAAAGKRWRRRHKVYWRQVDATSAADRQHLRDLYDGSIRYTDDVIAPFLARVAELGLRDRVIIALLSDHGEEFGEHGAFLHENVYQEVLRVPLIIRFPAAGAAAAGRRVSQPVRLIDVMPTLLDRIGLPIPEYVQGRSLLPLVVAPEPGERDVFSHWLGRRQMALRSGRWKYFARLEEVWWGTRRAERLYDLRVDPGEQTDIRQRHDEVLARLRARVSGLIDESAALRAGVPASNQVELDPDTRQQLEALGYLAAE